MRRDRHLNIFHNYNNEHISGKSKKNDGDNETVKGRGIIEDNVTRAFIIYLDFLSKTGNLQDFFRKLIEDLPKKKIGSRAQSALKKIKSPQFDLQYLDSPADRRRVKEEDVAKVLMIISTVPFNLQTLSVPESGSNSKSRAGANQDTSDQKNLHSGQQLSSNGETEQTGQTEGENRADAWILQKKDKGETIEVAVLIEAKIGDNQISTNQLKRHLCKEKFGFRIPSSGLKEFCETNVINLTWRDIDNSLEKFETLDQAVNYFTSNLKEYILMSNGDVDIKNLLKEDTDSIERKQIFAYILGKVNEKMKHHFENTAEGATKIKMSGRPLAGLWDFWGIPDANGVPQRSPHISLRLNDDYMLIGFDTYDKSQKSVKKLEASLLQGKIANYIKTKSMTLDQRDTLHRYRLSLSEDRLWDGKKGQIKGEMYNKFKLEFDFDFLLRQRDPGKFLENSFLPYLKMGIKRFSLFYTLRIPYRKMDSFDKTEDAEIIRQDQKLVELFKDEEKLVNLLYNQIIEFYEFVEEMK